MALTPNHNPNHTPADCAVNDTSQPPKTRFANDGVSKNPNVVNGKYVAPVYNKGTYDLSTSPCAETDSNYMASLMSEQLNIAAGPVNVFAMLGIHNQGSTLDQPGNGFPLSSGAISGTNALNVFNVTPSAGWSSVQTGSLVTSSPSFIGYDFGTLKSWNGSSDRYAPSALVRLKVSTIKIKQSLDPLKRATQLRVEASEDGLSWKRIDVINVQSTHELITIGVNSNAAYNKWRIVPTFFTGVASNNNWEVLEIHLLESSQISLENIEDFVLLENRARSYCHTSTMLKCTYDLLDVQSELARFGINLPQTYIFTCSFADMVIILGRPVVIGDIVELPGEIQYDPNLMPVRKWLEVTDAGWSTDGYTPNWRPNLYRFYAQPIMPSIEHKDILGVPGQVDLSQSDDSFLTNLLQNDQAYSATDVIKQESLDLVPQTGEDPQNLQSGKALLGNKGTYDGLDLYAQDAIPPNGAQYTTGDILPPASEIADGHYHRQTYVTVAYSIRPPERLLQWNSTKGRWKVIEVNTRGTQDSHKKTISRILSSNNMKPDQKI